MIIFSYFIIFVYAFFLIKYKQFILFILLSTFIFALTFKDVFLRLFLNMSEIGFTYQGNIDIAYIYSLVFLSALLLPFHFFYYTLSMKSKKFISYYRTDEYILVWFLILFSITILIVLYRFEWIQGNRIGGTSTVGTPARIIFSFIAYLWFVFIGILINMKVYYSNIRYYINVIFVFIFFYVLLSMIGYRGVFLIGVAIWGTRNFVNLRMKLSHMLYISIFLLFGIIGKKLLSGVKANELLKFGGQGDYVQVFATSIEYTKNVGNVDFSALFNYLFSLFSISRRNEFELFHISDLLNIFVNYDYVNSAMGFNVSSFHTFFLLASELGIVFVFIMSMPLSYFLYKLQIKNRLDPLFVPIYISFLFLIFNFGSLKSLIVYTIYTFILLILRAMLKKYKNKSNY